MKSSIKNTITMKRIYYYTLLISLFLINSIDCFAQRELTASLEKLPNVRVSRLSEDSKTKIDTRFSQNFELFFEQPINHQNKEKGTFHQRAILSHIGKNRPLVVILEGYSIYSAKASELAKLLDANQLVIEHRFFGNSKPEKIPWQELTVKQAAADQHHIIQIIKELYPNSKIITTGISKGGQTTVFHKALYPKDSDVAIPYVAPMNISNEDSRIYDFLDNVGTAADRARIYRFQCELFERKAQLLPKAAALAKAHNYQFVMGLERAYDLSILEIPFAFWQWGKMDITEIPDKDTSNEKLYDVWLKINPLTFFEEQHIENIRPFFWQAMTEIGMYGYEVAPFSKYLSDSENITFNFSLPANEKWRFTPQTMQNILEYLDTTTDKLLFIYGEQDPWSATAYRPKQERNNVKAFFNPKGSHMTRIHSFPKEIQIQIKYILTEWLGEELK